MPQCEVEIIGRDRETHGVTVDALSIFDAADKAMQSGWALLWWYDPMAPITVRKDGQEWKVPQHRVRRWRRAAKEKADKPKQAG
jgi:hypothetical protein